MKNLIGKYKNKATLLLMSLFLGVQTFAQDGLDIDVDLDGNDTPAIFERPIFWIGVAVLLIILALIMKGKK